MFPQELKENNKTALDFLEKAISTNRMANSYVLISKDEDLPLKVSIEIAKILNCKTNTKPSKSCNNCLNCKWINNLQHPQAFILIEPDSESKKKQIKVEQIRTLLNELSSKSTFYRIILFKNANTNTFTTECCNLLLKVVEEAIPNTLFIFASNSKDLILPTILSRSQTLYLNSRFSFTSQDDSLTMIELNKNNFYKGKELADHLKKQEIDLELVLLSKAFYDYEKLKYNTNVNFPKEFEKLNLAYKKHKAFMQNKIILEDLILAGN